MQPLEAAISFELLGQAVAVLWTARQGVRLKPSVQAVEQLASALGDVGVQFMVAGETVIQEQFIRCVGSVTCVAREMVRTYSRGGETCLDDLEWSVETTIDTLDRAEDELRIWGTGLLRKQQEIVPVVAPPLVGTTGTHTSRPNIISVLHGIQPDPQHPAVEAFNLLKKDFLGSVEIADELANATEPIVAEGDRIRVIPHFSDREAGE